MAVGYYAFTGFSDAEAVMMSQNLTELPKSWIACQHAEEGAPMFEANRWALESMGRLMVAEPWNAWQVVEEIYEQSDADEWVLENLGSGPVETLLRMQVEAVVPLATTYLKANPGFIDVLKHVWPGSLGREAQELLKG